LTFGEGLAMLLFPGWYPPFVQRSGPPSVGPASVPAAGAHVEHRLLAGSMRGTGSCCTIASDNFDLNKVSTRRCFSAVMFLSVETTLFVNSFIWSLVDRNGT
jgi:hypothetical protein